MMKSIWHDLQKRNRINAENWSNGPFENGFQEILLPDQNTGQNKCNHFFEMATDDITGTLAPQTTPDYRKEITSEQWFTY